MEPITDARPEPRPADDRTVRELVSAVIEKLAENFRAERRLAALEVKTKLRKGAKAGALLGAAAVLGFFAAACFIGTCIVALAIVLPLWLAFLVIGVLLAGIAGGAFVLGRVAVDEVDLVPQKTLETLKDTIDWVKAEWARTHLT